MTPATPASTVSPRRHDDGLRSRQQILFCGCGQGSPALSGLCHACYRARSRSRARFDGNRELVLARDRACLGCGAGNENGRRLHVHHRRPGFHDPDWLITLCGGCHARIHHLAAIRRWIPEPVVELWTEQHPGIPVQLQFSLALSEMAVAA